MNCLRNLLFVLLSSQLVFVGCNRNGGNPDEPVLPDTYQYTAFDLDGHLLATGTLALSFEGTAIAGVREIKGDCPEAGSGSIAGQMQSDNTVEIELNPGSVALVILKGKIDGKRIVGDRLFDTGGPPIARKIGVFVAVTGPPAIGFGG